jgi:histidine triad (HIT) family protein
LKKLASGIVHGRFSLIIVWMENMGTCLFCKIVAGTVAAATVWEDAATLVFLDHRPLFPGHCLVIPKSHYETLTDLPPDKVGPLFGIVRRITAAVERAMDADGSLVAINNRVSQSVPHLHIHVVPRRKKDGLRGFFWPRQKYASASEMEQVRDRLREAVALTEP